MLKSRPIVAFVATTDPKRAKAFYAKTLGLRLVSEDDFALAFDAGGTRLRVAIVKTLQPAGYTVLGWIVPDIAKAVRDLLKRVLSSGGTRGCRRTISGSALRQEDAHLLDVTKDLRLYSAQADTATARGHVVG